MKYLVLVTLIIASLFSCKKEITCSCYVSTNSGGGIQNVVVKSKSDFSSKQKACEAEQVKRSTQTETWECSVK